MKLIETSTGRELSPGDSVRTFRDEEATLIDIEEPRHIGSTGRVFLRFKDQRTVEPMAFFPGVIGAEWKPADWKPRRAYTTVFCAPGQEEEVNEHLDKIRGGMTADLEFDYESQWELEDE